MAAQESHLEFSDLPFVPDRVSFPLGLFPFPTHIPADRMTNVSQSDAEQRVLRGWKGAPSRRFQCADRTEVFSEH
jgi:hypothetical protein